MNRKTFYVLFILASSVANIFFTALIIAALFAIFFIVLYIAKAPSQMYANALFASFTIGLVLSFFLYSKLTMKIVKKHKLDERYGNPPQKTKTTRANTKGIKGTDGRTNLPHPALENTEVEK